jgi:predicted RNA-binding Zn ribbon-like protein
LQQVLLHDLRLAGVAAEQLFVDFVNSEWYDGRGNLDERLLDPEWRAEFLRLWNLGTPKTPSASTLKALMNLRDVLRAVVEDCYTCRDPSAEALRSIARSLPPISMRLEVGGEPTTATWVARSSTWAFVEAEIIRSCLRFLAGPARARLRRCDNDGCRWAFVDASRNGGRRWCDPGICGNVSKVRAYRRRVRRGRLGSPPS